MVSVSNVIVMNEDKRIVWKERKYNSMKYKCIIISKYLSK